MAKKHPDTTVQKTPESSNAMNPATSRRRRRRDQVFISYARADTMWMDAIRQNLDILPDFQIESWVDKSNLGPGQQIDARIKEGIESSDVALLLISPAFVQSPYIQEKEIGWLKARAAKGGLTIIYAPIAPREGEDEADIVDYLKKSGLEEQLASIPLDTPLESDPGRLDNAQRESRAKQVVTGIRRVIDPRFSLLQQNLDKNYVIHGRIAEGDSAIIYRARRESFSHDFAIKVLREPKDMKWFQSALRKASSVTNVKNIIQVFDHRFRSSLSYCVLKYIEGETLSSYIQNNSPISVKFTIEVINKIGEALIQVRSEKAFYFVFFNIRPENILLENDTQEPFLSLAVRSENKRGVAHLDDLRGRQVQSDEEWAYLVPEFLHAQSEEPIPSVTDQYLLGLMAYQMLTARIPERIDREKVKSGADPDFKNLESIQKSRGGFDHIYPVIDKMYSIEPRERFSNLAEAMSAITQPELHSLELVKQSYRRCTGDEKKSEVFFTDFYTTFLGNSEQARRLFKAHEFSIDDVSQVTKNEKWQKQRSIVGHTVLLLITFFEHQLRGERGEPTILTYQRGTHRQPTLHPDKDAYMKFLEALLETIGKHDESWTKTETVGRYWKELWTAVLMPGIEYMTN